MITSYLILSHLLADFILQPGKLIRWKTKSPVGVLFHVGVFFLVAILFLIPYIEYWQTWAVIGGISVIHYISDQTKVYVESKRDTFPMPFITDQAVHLFSLVVGGYIISAQSFEADKGWFYENIYHNWTVWAIAALIIFIVYIIDIIFFQKAYLTSYNLKKEDKGNRAKIVRQKLSIFIFVYVFYLSAAILIDYF